MNHEEPDPDEEDERVQATIDPTASGAKPHVLRTVRARDLLGSERVLRIEHEGQVYTLRITRNDRLILTK
jgi:hemin uptake protein HemP